MRAGGRIHLCVGGGDYVRVCRGRLSWRVHMCGGDPFYRQRRSYYWFTYSGDTSIKASLGKDIGSMGGCRIPSAVLKQDAWQRQRRLNWAHWVDKRVCVRDDAYVCVGRGGGIAFKCVGGVLGWRVHLCGGDPFYRQRRSCYQFTFRGYTSIKASLGKDIGSMWGGSRYPVRNIDAGCVAVKEETKLGSLG